MAALLLGAWIAQRLGGTPSSNLTFPRANGPSIHITLTSISTGPSLQKLHLTGPNIQIQISRHSDSRFVQVCTSCPNHKTQEIYPADVESDAELIGEQLSRAGGRTLYSSLIPQIRELLQ